MFLQSITGQVTEFTADAQTRFQCTVRLSAPLEQLPRIEFGTLIAAENTFHSAKEKRFTILSILNAMPDFANQKPTKNREMTLVCHACPIGMELHQGNGKAEDDIAFADTYPVLGSGVSVLDDTTTARVLHQIAPDSRTRENGTRIDIGTYAANPSVKVGLDSTSLLRGNSAIISTRPRARTSITSDLVLSLLNNTSQPVHIVYCDVNNQNSISLISALANSEAASILCLNDKFVPPSVFSALRSQNDRQVMKRASFDYLDMLILPSVLEHRRQEFTFAIHGLLRSNKISIFRPNEQTVDQFINDIRVDILDGIDEDIEAYVNGLMNGIAETYQGERFGEKNTKDILEMIDEFGVDSKNHNARRTLYDLRAEVQSVFETYSKDIPSASRKTIPDIINELNDETRSSLIVMQGQKTTDILRFIGTLTQSLVEDRLKRLKIRVPVLFIFNNADEYVSRQGGRESGSERFQDIIGSILTSGRRHGLSFCLTMENAGLIDRQLARKIQSYFVGPISYGDETESVARLLTVSEELIRPAVNFDDGDFMFSSADSPYHRRVPVPVRTQKNTEIVHAFLDHLSVEQERRRKEFMAIEDDRSKRLPEERRPAQQRESGQRQQNDRQQSDRQPSDRQPSDRQPSDRQPSDRQPSDRQQGGRHDHGPRQEQQRNRQPQQPPQTQPQERPAPVISIPTAPTVAEERPPLAPGERPPLRFEFKPANVVRAESEMLQTTQEKPAAAAADPVAAEAPAADAAGGRNARRGRRGGRPDPRAPQAESGDAPASASQPPAAAKVPQKPPAVLPIEELTFEPVKKNPPVAVATPRSEQIELPVEAAKAAPPDPKDDDSDAKPAKGKKRAIAKAAKKTKEPAKEPKAPRGKVRSKKASDGEAPVPDADK